MPIPPQGPAPGFHRYVRRTAGRSNGGATERTPPPEWEGKRRRRVRQPPPDFEAQDAQALAYAERCGLRSPRVVDVKRLEGGSCAYLVRSADDEEAIMLVVERCLPQETSF